MMSAAHTDKNILIFCMNIKTVAKKKSFCDILESLREIFLQ